MVYFKARVNAKNGTAKKKNVFQHNLNLMFDEALAIDLKHETNETALGNFCSANETNGTNETNETNETSGAFQHMLNLNLMFDEAFGEALGGAFNHYYHFIWIWI